MLTYIAIRDFAVIKKTVVDWHPGFQVLTGETGSGKSVLLDAIHLVLGARQDTSPIRPGAQQADLTLCFDLTHNKAALNWMQQHDLPTDDCLIRRVIKSDSRSRTTINGVPLPQHLIRELAQHLLHIHSQHQHHNLLKPTHQRQRLDGLGGHATELAELHQIYCTWQQYAERLKTLESKKTTDPKDALWLQEQWRELEALSLSTESWNILNETHRRLHRQKDGLCTLQEALDQLSHSEPEGASEQLHHAIQKLEQLELASLSPALELLNNASIHLSEACEQLKEEERQWSCDEETLTHLEEQLTTWHDMARKHHQAPEQLPLYVKELAKKITSWEHIDEHIAQIKEAQDTLKKRYQIITRQLTAKRQKIANELSRTMTQSMQNLNMPGGSFAVRLIPKKEGIDPLGAEDICFYVATNPGQKPRPIHEIASGGELSRLSLALEVFSHQQHVTPTLIFDEVDAGTGGQTAQVIGQLLKQLGQKTQVIAITHLPQVAAQATTHFVVRKQISSNDTLPSTQVMELEHDDRLKELTTLMSGQHTETDVRAWAKDMLTLPVT